MSFRRLSFLRLPLKLRLNRNGPELRRLHTPLPLLPKKHFSQKTLFNFLSFLCQEDEEFLKRFNALFSRRTRHTFLPRSSTSGTHRSTSPYARGINLPGSQRTWRASFLFAKCPLHLLQQDLVRCLHVSKIQPFASTRVPPPPEVVRCSGGAARGSCDR